MPILCLPPEYTLAGQGKVTLYFLTSMHDYFSLRCRHITNYDYEAILNT